MPSGEAAVGTAFSGEPSNVSVWAVRLGVSRKLACAALALPAGGTLAPGAASTPKSCVGSAWTEEAAIAAMAAAIHALLTLAIFIRGLHRFAKSSLAYPIVGSKIDTDS
jgi:hypothetical protein